MSFEVLFSYVETMVNTYHYSSKIFWLTANEEIVLMIFVLTEF